MNRDARDVSAFPCPPVKNPRATVGRAGQLQGLARRRRGGRTGVGRQELGGGRDSASAFADGESDDSKTVHALENVLRDAVRDEGDGSSVFPHLVDRKNTVADEVGLGRGELGEDESGAIAEEDVGGEADGLEVLRLAGRGRDRDLLFADQGVDSRRLSDVGISDETDDHLLVSVAESDGDWREGGRSAARTTGQKRNAPSGACFKKRSSSSKTERILVR